MVSPNEIRQEMANQIVEALTSGKLPPGVDRGPWRLGRISAPL